ncbi:nicotinate-nucleotide--dimethylbenzimidazole phosphoribosyltransferase [Corticibacter populi]|uniref:Nicotinate-nucleotide--dimethylbenzimidazole phosphoribosyltransferase n=1 Tax=Corticibacter populi TaxID=1550736 RepID=A0A3M6R0B4_9BURK|nr:nicotinate-nucleotide--dimethylbenzimidazole phosphoribosyltransferase [Corticibacter populi]RMX08645.1 nicotinate-nucleotide--dimethylbenzimidazole phosphoribosyltransferase [Corticibacter populi]RZS35977.1 nicotinate-nucleotide-dimethylbenzimidazole phosphoribosyltransferase [Corticibacter populi]
MTSSPDTPIADGIPPIASLDAPALSERLTSLLDHKTKPLRALGRLEDLAHQLGRILGSTAPALTAPQALVFAADHGLARQGVSAYPADVTWQMVRNMLAGGAAISVLTRQHGIALKLIDCGVAQALPPHPDLMNCKVATGTADASEQPAMTAEQCAQAIAAGRRAVQAVPGNAVLLGEMGIGNTSAAALLLARLIDQPVEACAGAGTGVQGEAFARKLQVLRKVLARHAGAHAPLDVLAAMGGLEIAGMVGAILQAALERRVIVVDGFVTSAAVLVAARLQPNVLQRCVFSHLSHEQGHRLMLDAMGVRALLQMDMRLGEGSGAALAWPLLESACRILREMASFESAQVSGQTSNQSIP